MKIDPSKTLRQNLNMNRKVGDEKNQKVKESFKKVLNETKMVDATAQLEHLIEIIEEKAKKIKRNMTIQNLSEYRHFVKEFLKVFNEEFMHTRQTFSWNQGAMKSFTVIEEIDENVEALTNLFMEEQKDSLEVVQRLDAIRGLLMDLYI
ncbi:MAG: YaaR family protein [Halanaerobiales bacterium]|nr:YaaR family protein [Halanaerobiales bacterium]